MPTSDALSLTASMSVGYLLNRYFTFHHLETGRTLWHSLVRHYSVHAVGAGINIGVFSAILLLGQEMGGEVAVSATLPLLGVWIGGVAGMCFNFFFPENSSTIAKRNDYPYYKESGPVFLLVSPVILAEQRQCCAFQYTPYPVLDHWNATLPRASSAPLAWFLPR